MVYTVKTGRTRSHDSTRGLVGQSLEKGVMTDASLYMIGWEAGFQCMIGWRAGPCYVILQEEGFVTMSELSRLLLVEFQMNTRIVGIQRELVHDNIDRPQWCPAGCWR